MKKLFTKKSLGLFLLAAVILSLVAYLTNRSVEFEKSIEVKHGGVASAHHEASLVGMNILKQGGNAVDAATATAMALAVVYPQAGNLGGGGFLVMRLADGAKKVLDFRETAPALAGENMYLDGEGNYINESSTLGALAIGVPGTVRGFYQFHQKYGKLSWRETLQPAIQIAEHGFEVNSFLADRLVEYRDQLALFPATAEIFLPNGIPLKNGEILEQPNLAHTLMRIAESGDADFYDGEIAREIVASASAAGGILTLADLQNYQPVWRDPLEFEYRGHRIISVPPPSSGGALLAGILTGLELRGDAPLPLHSVDQITLLAEWEKHYFALRNQFLGDPAFVDNPLARILSPEFIKNLAQTITPGAVLPARFISPDSLLFNESRETTHFSVVDDAGNAVSVTYTLNGNFGCKLVAGATGILMNNEMDDFSVKAGVANMFGLVQGGANKIEAGKRMLSSMTPVIVEKDGQLAGLLGSPGGPTIITTVLQTLIHKIAYRQSLGEAILTNRFHHQWLPDKLYMEDAFPLAVEKELENRGYEIVREQSIGDVHGIWRTDNGWEICSDPRGNGLPAGY